MQTKIASIELYGMWMWNVDMTFISPDSCCRRHHVYLMIHEEIDNNV